MKKIISLVAAVVVGGAITSVAVADTIEPVVVPTQFSTSYIPDGFDTNDHIQIVAEGIFSNTCYRPLPAGHAIDHEAKTITLNPKAHFYDGFCLRVLMPWHQTINLGLLKAGEYQVYQTERASSKLGTLKVRTTTNSSADDFLYAPVSQAYFNSKPNGNAEIKISGIFPNSCFKLVDVMVNVQKNVVVVQPIAEVEDSGNCGPGMYTFERTVHVNNVPKGRYLLHVRSLNSKSFNNLVDAF